jgi:transposase
MIPRRGRDGVRRVITDKAWQQLEPILARILSPRGAPPKLGLREFLEAVLYVDRTGIPWRDLPPPFGAWDAVYQRFRRWQRNGTWAALWRALQAPAAASARRLFVDSTVVRAHQHAAGGPGDGPDRALGRSRGGWGTKIHLAACDERTALGIALTAGQAGDAPAFEPTLCDVPDETAATAVVADRSYDSDAIRADLTAAGLEAVIPARRNRVDPPPYDAEAYKEREKAERLVNRLKRMRRVATRYERLGPVFLAMVHVACIASILL